MPAANCDAHNATFAPSTRVLISRARFPMDAPHPPASRFGDVVFDPLSGELRVAGELLRLRPQSAAVLSHLLGQGNRVVGREELVAAVWGDLVVTENSLTQCIAEIRRALGPSRESWLETHARRGYRLNSPPTEPIPEGKAERWVQPKEASVIGPLAARGRRHFWSGWLAAAGLVLVAAALWEMASGWHRTPIGEVSLAVLPFDSPTAGAGADSLWFAEVVGEDLTFNLSRIPGARVIARVSTQNYPVRGADLQRIGAELKVRYVVTGSVDRQADFVTLRLQLVDAASGALRWSERVDTPLADLHESERGLANRMANALHLQLVERESERVQRAAQSNPAADDLALQAWAAWNRGTPVEVARARDLARQALVLDPHSILAWKTLASWHLRARLNQSIPADQAEAGADEAAGQAMALDPSHPLVHTVWGAVQVLRGRYPQGQEALEHEIRTNPSHPVAYSYLAVALLMLGQPAVAAERYQQAIDISPRDPRLSRFERGLALAYLHLGKVPEALQHARAATRAPQVDRSAWATLATACRLAADPGCERDALLALRKVWPDVSVAAVESEWPPQTEVFRQQHRQFLEGLRQVVEGN